MKDLRADQDSAQTLSLTMLQLCMGCVFQWEGMAWKIQNSPLLKKGVPARPLIDVTCAVHFQKGQAETIWMR